MEIEKLKYNIEHAKEIDRWSFMLMKISANNKVPCYELKQENFNPDGVLRNCSVTCLNRCGEYANSWTLDDYVGEFVNGRIYQMHNDNLLVCDAFNSLMSAISNPEVDERGVENSYNGYMLSGCIDDIRVILVSMHTPLKVFKNKFLVFEGLSYTELKVPVLTLREDIDILIIGNDIFFFSILGEKLFNMERSFKTSCNKKVFEITKSNILTDNEVFSSIANRGVNPRRFVSFNPGKFDALVDFKERVKLADKFNLCLSKDGKIDTSDEQKTCRLIKFLCDKAMLDPLDNSPVEVSATKKWL